MNACSPPCKQKFHFLLITGRAGQGKPGAPQHSGHPNPARVFGDILTQLGLTNDSTQGKKIA